MTGASHPDLSALPRWLLDSLGEGVSIADASGQIVYSNPAADRILGVPATDKPPAEWTDYYGVFLPDGQTRFPPDQYPLVRALRGEDTNEVEMVVRNRTLPWDVRISATGRPLRAPGGEIVGGTVVFRDVTALTGAQAALARALDELRRAKALEEELSTFVVHDVNGPLTGILAISELLLLEDELSGEVRTSIREVKDLAESLHGIITDLLDLKVAEDGSFRPHRENIWVRDILTEVCAVVSPRAELAGKRLEMNGDGGLDVFADPDLLRRILHNLIDNSIKYAPSGGTIRVGAVAGSSGMVRIEVCDEGPGVPRDLRNVIFEKYTRMERDRKERPRISRGLGLRFCRVATEAQRGRIWVEDAEPSGARFCVELPAARRSATA